jgi:hypothetical protein
MSLWAQVNISLINYICEKILNGYKDLIILFDQILMFDKR